MIVLFKVPLMEVTLRAMSDFVTARDLASRSQTSLSGDSYQSVMHTL